MKAVFQETPTSCFRACVATVLGINFSDAPAACDGATWDWEQFQKWLAESRNMQAVEFLLDYNHPRLYPVYHSVTCILTGNSPRQCVTGKHAVVGQLVGIEGFEVIHDPHESGSGIIGDPSHVTFFVPFTSFRGPLQMGDWK